MAIYCDDFVYYTIMVVWYIFVIRDRIYNNSKRYMSAVHVVTTIYQFIFSSVAVAH